MIDRTRGCHEIGRRIRADITYHNGQLPERNAIAWRGNLAALLEWDVISLAHYDALVELLPRVKDDPAQAILLGRESTREMVSSR